MSTPNIFEVRKTINVDKTVNLLDLNGQKINFQSEFFLSTKDPSTKVLASVVNQTELDEGKFNFEETENGKIAMKVIYQENVHQNHYLAIKKHPDDSTTQPIVCDVVIKLQEIPPVEQSTLNSFIEEEKVEEPPVLVDDGHDKIIEIIQQKDSSAYITVGVLCLVLFVLIAGYKILKR